MDEFDEPEEPNPDELSVDELLDRERPDRYDTDDHEWMEAVVRKIRDQLLEQVRRAEAIDGAEWLAEALRSQHADRTEDFRRATEG